MIVETYKRRLKKNELKRYGRDIVILGVYWVTKV